VSLHCGNCGYNVHGLPTSVCPECGSDLDIVGRVHPRTARRKRIERATLYAVFMPVVVIAAMLGLERTVIPGVVQERAFVTLRQPQSDAYRQFRVRFDTSGWYFPGTHPADEPWRSCRVALDDGDRRQHSIIINLGDNTFHEDGRTTLRRSVTTENLLTWLADLGVSKTSPDFEKEIAVVQELVVNANAPSGLFAKKGRRVRVTGGTRSSWGHSASSPQPLLAAGIDASAFGDARAKYEQRLDTIPVIHEALIVILGAVWVFGIWRILRTKRVSGAPDDATTAD